MAITDPTEIASLALWYDASDAATITEVSSEVSQWDDKSGNNLDLTQANASFRPVVGSINGYDSIVFAGASGEVLDAEGTLDLNQQNVSGYIVLTPTSTLNNDDPLNLLNGTALRMSVRQLGGGVDIVCFWQGSGGNVTLRNDDVLATNTTSFHIFRSRLSTDGDVDWLADDGTEDVDAGISVLFLDDIDTIGVGARPSGSGAWTGHIHEVAIFDEYLSDADRDEVNAYLEAKYFGVQVAAEPSAFLATVDTDIDVDVSTGPDVEVDADTAGFLGELVTTIDIDDAETLSIEVAGFLGATDVSVELHPIVNADVEAFLATTDAVVEIAPTQIELLDAWDSDNSNTLDFPVSSGTDRLVVAGIYIEGVGVDDTPTAQYGDQDMTLTVVAETSGGSSAVLYHILEAGIAAATGTAVTISPSSGTSSLSVGSYENVHQTNPIVETVQDVNEPGETASQDIDTEADGLIVAQAGAGSSTTHSWTSPLVEQTDQTASPTTASGSAADLVPTDGSTVAVEHDSGLSNPNRTAVCAVSFRVSDNVATVAIGAEAFLATIDTDLTVFPLIDVDAVGFLAEASAGIQVITEASIEVAGFLPTIDVEILPIDGVTADVAGFLATIETAIDVPPVVDISAIGFLAEIDVSINSGLEQVDDFGGSGTGGPKPGVRQDAFLADIMAAVERRKLQDEQELAETMPAIMALLDRIN